MDPKPCRFAQAKSVDDVEKGKQAAINFKHADVIHFCNLIGQAEVF